jgi:hypothetical protein
MRILSVVTLALCLACGSVQGALTHFYQFSTDASDSSGNGNDGTLVGNASIIPGPMGGGVLDLRQGTNGGPETESGVSLPLNAQGIPGANLTLSACIRLERMPQFNEAFIMGWVNTNGTNSPNFQFRINDLNRNNINPVGLGRWDGGNFNQVASPTTPGSPDLWTNPPEWRHVAATIENNTDVRIYVDGVLAQSGTFNNGLIGTPTTFWLGTLQVGAAGNPNDFLQPFEGQMDNVRIYNNALSANDIAAIYRADCAIPEPAAIVSALAGLGLAWAYRRRS